MFRWATQNQLSEVYKEAFTACNIPASQLLRSHLLRTSRKLKEQERGVDKDTIALMMGHTTEVADKHYTTKKTAEVVRRELEKSVS